MRLLIILVGVVGAVWILMWNVGDHFEKKEQREAQQQAQALVTEISSDDALKLAKVVDSSGSVDVRKALTNAMADGKVTYAEFNQVFELAEKVTQAREREIAKAALATAAHGYSE